MQNKYFKIYNENSGPLELCHWCYRLTKVFYIGIKNHTASHHSTSSYLFLKIYEKRPMFSPLFLFSYHKLSYLSHDFI